MKKLWVALLAMLFVVMCVGTSLANARDWQYTQHLSIEIGVRDKFGDINKNSNVNYTANFTVTTPDGKVYFYNSKGTSDNWVISVVPYDYKGLILSPGDYSWKCHVDGELAGSGQFRVQRDGHNLTISTF